MARCYSCKKSFDYEKYYGICPKCGTYNKENVSEKESIPEQAAYGGSMPGDERWSNSTYSSTTGAYGSTAGTTQGRTAPKKKASALEVLIFTFLIVGIVGTITVPVFSIFTGGLGFLDRATSSTEVELVEGEEFEMKEQAPEIIDAAVGETCALGRNGEVTVTVEDAAVLVMAGHISEFPQDENLIAISLSFQNTYEEYYYYAVMERVYVGYGNQIYKGILDTYDMEDYMSEIGNIQMVDSYDISYTQGGGKVLVFVPTDVTSVDLYLESRNEETNDIIEIYRIPLEIKPGGEI